MIRRIIVEGFMSHRHTVVEPASGLTVIVGPNNCGKSAFVAALHALAYNARGDYMIRHGADVARVTLETDDGHTLIWERQRGRAACYRIDGRLIERVGAQVPEELHHHLRLPRVAVDEQGGHRFDIHFGEQKQPIFLLDKPPSHAAAFFASSSDAALLLRMRDLHKQRTNERKREVRRLTRSATTLQHSLDALEGVEALGERVEAMELEYEALGRLEHAIVELERDLAALSQAQRAFEGLDARHEVLSGLRPPPLCDDLSALSGLNEALAPCQRQARRLNAISDVLKPLRPPYERHPADELGALLDALAPAEVEVNALRAASASLSPLSSPPPLPEPAPLAELCASLASWLRAFASQDAGWAALSGLLEPPESLDVRPVGALCASLDVAERDHQRVTRRADALSPLQSPPELALEEPLSELLGRLSPMFKRAARVGALSATLGELRGVPEVDDVGALQSLWASLAPLSRRVEAQHAALRALSELSAPPPRLELEPLASLIVEQQRVSREFGQRWRLSQAVDPLNTPPHIHEVTPLVELTDAVARAQSQAQRDHRREAIACRLRQAPRDETGPLMELLSVLEVAVEADERQRRRVSAVEALGAPPVVQDEARLEQLVATMATRHGDAEAQRLSQRALDGDLAEVSTALRTLVGELGECPTCQSRLEDSPMVHHICRDRGEP